MYDDLRTVIQSVVGEGPAEDIVDTLYALEEISYQDHILPIQQTMALRDYYDNEWFATTIRTICYDNLLILVKRFGIGIDEDQDIPLEALLQIFICLIRIERYPFKQSIYYIIDNSDSSIEAFDDIMEEFYGVEYQPLVDYFSHVSSDLIDRLKTICQEEMSTEEYNVESAPLSDQYMNLLKGFYFDFLGINNQLLEKLEERSLLITMPMHVFYGEMIKNIITLCEIGIVQGREVAKHECIARLIFTYTMIGYIKDSKDQQIDKNLASKLYSLIENLQEDVIELDPDIQKDILADALVEEFRSLSTRLAEINNG